MKKHNHDDQTASALDAHFQQTMNQVTILCGTFNNACAKLMAKDRIVRVRMDQWMQRLQEPVKLIAWKKNRNLYGDILLIQLQRGAFDKPFDKLPVSGPLPMLPSWMTMHKKYAKKQQQQTIQTPEYAEQEEHDMNEQMAAHPTFDNQRHSHFQQQPLQYDDNENYNNDDDATSPAPASSRLALTDSQRHNHNRKKVTFFSPLNQQEDGDNQTLYIKSLEKQLEEERNKRHELEQQKASSHVDEQELQDDYEFLLFLRQYEVQCNTLLNSFH